MKTNQTALNPTVAPERRPNAAREWNLLRLAARRLIARGVPPNAISLAGMGAGIIAGLALAATPRVAWHQVLFIAAVATIALRGAGNLLDGMVAVGSGKASPSGELFNEIPDRISDMAILIGAGYAIGGNPTLGFLAALAAVFTAYIRAEGKVAGAAQHYCGPMAKPARMFIVFSLSLYSGLTPASWQPSAEIGGQTFGLMAMGLGVIALGGIITAARRLKRIAGEVSKAYPIQK
jgi:phosphatidylglycerophosphate synthase